MSTVEVEVTTAPATDGEAEVAATPSRRTGILRALLAKRTGRIGVVILLVLVACAVFAPVIAPHDPLTQSLSNAYARPVFAGGTSEHLLGTDNLGRDILSRLIHGARISLAVGLVAATVSAVLGTALGLWAGWKGGLVHTIILRVADIQFALPFLVVCLAFVSVYGPGIGKVIVLLSLWGWAMYARTIAVSVQRVKRLDFVLAVRLAGARVPRTLLRHVLPNVWGPAIVLWSSAAGGLIMAESSLSLLGLGVQSPEFSWGSMLASGPTYLRTAWWMTLFPAAALVITVIAFNLVGDALRDVVNPRLVGEDHAPQLD